MAIVSQNSFVLALWGYRTIVARYVENSVSDLVACVKRSTKGWGIAPFWGAASLPEEVSRDMGYRSDSIAISHDMGPLIADRRWANLCHMQMGSDRLTGFIFSALSGYALHL